MRHPRRTERRRGETGWRSASGSPISTALCPVRPVPPPHGHGDRCASCERRPSSTATPTATTATRPPPSSGATTTQPRRTQTLPTDTWCTRTQGISSSSARLPHNRSPPRTSLRRAPLANSATQVSSPKHRGTERRRPPLPNFTPATAGDGTTRLWTRSVLKKTAGSPISSRTAPIASGRECDHRAQVCTLKRSPRRRSACRLGRCRAPAVAVLVLTALTASS